MLLQRAGSPGLYGGGAAAAVPPQMSRAATNDLRDHSAVFSAVWCHSVWCVGCFMSECWWRSSASEASQRFRNTTSTYRRSSVSQSQSPKSNSVTWTLRHL